MLDVERKVEMLKFSRNSMGGQEVRDFRPTQGPGEVGLFWGFNIDSVVGDSCSGQTVHVERVPFDLEREARDILTSGMPYAEKLVKTQVDACWW